MPRAMWKGSLDFGSVQVPLKLYSAATDQSVHFRLLHRKDKTPVKQRMIDPSTGKEISKEQMQKAVEIEPARFVAVTDEELESLQPEGDRSMAVTQLVPKNEIAPQWLNRPYYLGPDGDPISYAAVSQTLQAEKVVAITSWVMRKKHYFGALTAAQQWLILLSLKYADEVILASELEIPQQMQATKQELDLAKQLVRTMKSPFDLSRYQNDYQQRLKSYLDAKAEGKVSRLPKLKKQKPRKTSLEDALRRSLQTVKESRVA